MRHEHLPAPPDMAARPATGGDTPTRPALTMSVRTVERRILVTLTEAALLALSRPPHEESLLSILSRHARKFRAVAIQLAHRHRTSHVTIDADAVWWGADDVD